MSSGNEIDEERWQHKKLKDLEGEVRQIFAGDDSSSSSSAGVHLQCAAAYMLRSHKRAGYDGSAVSSATADAFVVSESSSEEEGDEDASSADEFEEGEYGEGVSNTLASAGAGGVAQGRARAGYDGSGRSWNRGVRQQDRREMELRRNIALCFQWVVAKELAELGEGYKKLHASGRAAPSC
jgi:hypothetical protein